MYTFQQEVSVRFAFYCCCLATKEEPSSDLSPMTRLPSLTELEVLFTLTKSGSVF